MAYVYLHTRLDKNEPFYVGIGEDVPGEEGRYRRANMKRGRNGLWNKVINKAEYKVEILINNITYKEALNKEIELIAFYGRKNIKNGPLCNLTDGGEGTRGKKLQGKQLEIVRKRAISQRKKVIQKNIDGSIVKVWDCVMDAVKVGFTSSGIGCCCNGIMKTHKGYMWKFENPTHVTRKGKDNFRTYKKVVQIDPKTNMIVKVWRNADQAGEFLSFYPGYITGCCKGKFKERYGYKWEYFDENKEYQFDANHEIQDNQKRKEKKKVVQIDLSNNEIVNIFNSYYCVREKGLSPSSVWACINNRRENGNI